MRSYYKLLLIFIVIYIDICIFNNNITYGSTETNTLQDGTYIIKSTINNDYVVDVSGGSKQNCANIQLYASNRTEAQKFNIKYLNNGYYTIESVNSGKVLDVANGGKVAGTNLWQYELNNTDAQKWIIKKNPDNTYSIVSKLNNLYIDISEGIARNGQNIQVYTGNDSNAQKFIFEKVVNNVVSSDIKAEKTIEDGIYTVKSSINNNYVVDVSGGSKQNCANIQLYASNRTEAQKFNIKYLNSGYYTIESVNSGKVLDVANAGRSAGTNVWQYESNNTDAQKWIIKKNSDKTYSIISKLNSLYIDISEGIAKNEQNIQVYTGNNSNAQKFILEEVSNIVVSNIKAEKTIEDGIYEIKTKLNENYVLDVSGASRDNTANVQIWENANVNQQKFKITYNKDGYYNIENINSGKVLDVANAGKSAGTNVWQYESNNTDAQKWIIKRNSDDSYSIISKLNNLYIDVYDGVAKNGQNIQINESSDTNAQKFIFEETKANYNIDIDTSKYPGYKEKIEKLKKDHPNWNFELLYTGLRFEDVTSGECQVHSRNLVPTSYSGEWVCPVCGTTLYDSGWYCASEKAVAYYMDPRNFLDDNNIFQFEKLNIYESSTNTIQGIKNKVADTFLNDYAEDIDTACRNKNVNSYYIVARLLQEQGKKGTTIGKGMDGGDGKIYYDPFNIGASGNGYNEIYNNALKTAKAYGWDTMEKALEGGIDFCKKNWLENYQNTLYQNKFDIDTRNGTSLYTHQYMQNLMAAYSEAKTLRSMYSQTDCLEGNFIFIIPIYEGMDSTLSKEPTINSESYSLNMKVNANGGLKLRSGANTNSNVIELVPDGEIILSVQRGINDNWNKVITKDGKIGYMSGNYLQIIDTIKNCNYTAKVKTNDGSGCKVRVGPSINLDRVTTLSEGTEVTVIEKGTFNNIDGYNWCRVIIGDGRQVYMPLKYLN